MKGYLAAAALLPPPLRRAAETLPESDKRRCEEIRLRRNMAASVLLAGRERTLSVPPVSEEDIRAVLENATRSSLHAAVQQLRRGFITGAGGVRVGICGTAVMGERGMEGLRAFSSAALRVPREVPGCADEIWPELSEGGFASLLIIAPPGAGKTTLLRELIRRLSRSGVRVCAADERGELAGCCEGAPAFDVGPCTDIMTGVPRAEAAEMMLRAMNPQVLAMDEITGAGDAAALLDAVGCGVELIATVHGTGPADVVRRPACRALLEEKAFARYVTVEDRGGVRRYRPGIFP